MSFRQKTCFEIVCDVTPCDSWDDGMTPHFDTKDQAAEYARAADWMVTDDKTLCHRHATEADCAATGHQWDDWRETELHGVRFRKRWCEHCGDTDFNPPFKELSPKLAAVREAERIVADADRGRP